MNPPLAAIILSFLVPAMGLVLILVGIARLAGLSPTGPRWCAGLVLCSLAIVATPVGGLALARWLAGVVDRWSLSAMALLVSTTARLAYSSLARSADLGSIARIYCDSFAVARSTSLSSPASCEGETRILPTRIYAVPASHISKPHLSAALGRVPIQRPFKPSRGRRSFEVTGQNFTIRCIPAVEFPVGVPIRTKRRACQRDACEQALRTGIRQHLRAHLGVRLSAHVAANRARRRRCISAERKLIG